MALVAQYSSDADSDNADGERQPQHLQNAGAGKRQSHSIEGCQTHQLGRSPACKLQGLQSLHLHKTAIS